ncbi:MAG: flagellar hook-basal body complex protein FliE [Myxococcota bacterium]|jgi:flagellar hook-basal body complex protein FliE
MSVIIKGNQDPRVQAFLRNSDLNGINRRMQAEKTTQADKTTEAGEANAVGRFASALGTHVDEVNDQIKTADTTAQGFLKGEDTSIHEVMIAMSKADVSFRLMSQIGKRVVEAYQEIQRMQV